MHELGFNGLEHVDAGAFEFMIDLMDTLTPACPPASG